MSDHDSITTSPSVDKRPLKTAFYGSGLFLKFFFWFWLAVVLTGILVVAYTYVYHFAPENRRIFRMSRELLEENGQMVVDAYEKHGIEAALSVRLPGTFWLFNEQLENLFVGHRKFMKSGKKNKRHDRESFFERLMLKDNEIKKIAGRILSEPPSETEDTGMENLIASVVTSESQRRYVIFSHVPTRARHQKFLIDRMTETMPIFLLVTAVFCYGLARYMVKPISELSEASRNFARGDLSARASKSAESRLDEIGELTVDFNDMANKIETLIRSQRRLFSDISHELRSPLARLQVTVELLQKKLKNSDQPMLERIEKEIGRMNSLIEEVLSYSRLETGNFEENRQEINLGELMNKVCSDADFEATARNCRVKLTLNAEPTIKCIDGLIERAVENLLRNAVRYSPDNAVVEAELSVKDDKIIISVNDKGPGVPEEEIARLFAPFYRYQEDRDRKTGGTGLGLAIARRAIQLHKGDIHLQNRPKGGLSATITLPLK